MVEAIKSGDKTVYPFIFPINYGAMTSINYFLYDDGKSLTLIDGGIQKRENEEYFHTVLKHYNLSINDIDQIYLTHHHEDHIGVVNRVLATKQVPIYAHHLAIPRLYFEEQYLRQKKEFFQKIYTEYGCIHLAGNRFEKMEQTYQNREKLKLKANITPLYDGDSIGGMTVIEVPGHSPDSIIFYDDATKWQFAGDLVLENTPTNALIDYDENLNLLPSVRQYEDSLKKSLELPTTWIFPGHQHPFQNHRVEIEKKLQRLKRKEARIVETVEKGYQTTLEIAEALYHKRVEREFLFIMSEVIGYLDYAISKGKIEKTMRNGQWHFTKIEENEQ